MTSPSGCLRLFSCALAALVGSWNLSSAGDDRLAHESIVFLQPLAIDYDGRASSDLAIETLPTVTLPAGTMPVEMLPEAWSPGEVLDAEYDGYSIPDGFGPYNPSEFFWQVGPSGLIYRSYLAGPLEPRISITPFFSQNHSYWDATVGGRGGVLRYGNCDPLHPQGWQLDAYGAAVVRMDAENHQDLNSSDFVFGFPLTYGIENWQFKFGYAHLSSHLGDEYARRHPGSIQDRINYVRDGIVFGTSWYPVAACRLYGEIDWAFHVSDGARPLAFQFGNELSHPGPTGLHGSPFFAFNGRLRQDVDFGGDLTAQTGWLWRGVTGKTFRFGGHYYNGKSSQSQFYFTSEQQIGIGLWYDF